jgi:hypothetical protein
MAATAVAIKIKKEKEMPEKRNATKINRKRKKRKRENKNSSWLLLLPTEAAAVQTQLKSLHFSVLCRIVPCPCVHWSTGESSAMESPHHWCCCSPRFLSEVLLLMLSLSLREVLLLI